MAVAPSNGRPVVEPTIAPELQAELDGVGWMYEWPLRTGGFTPLLGETLRSVHETRAEMIEPVVRAALADAGPDACALDLACNEGWFSHRLLEWGAAGVVGIDAREHNVRRARLIAEHYEIGPDRLRFERVDALTLDPGDLGRFDVVLLLGLIYHLEQPLQMIRLARRLTRSVCVIESQLIRQERPLLFSNGSPHSYSPLAASFGGYVEDEPDNALASVAGVMSLVPNRAALELMPRWAGFDDVEPLIPAARHDRQYLWGDRGIVAAHVGSPRRRRANGLPLPPRELMRRVGTLLDGEDPMGRYERHGQEVKRTITALLPEDWSWEGKRALDFGCGAGRVLRHFQREAQVAELSGCDIDEPSIAWLEQHLSPPFAPYVVQEEPGLPHEDDALDLVWAASVFTHLTDHWAGWLIELHRVLRPGGLLIASYLGANMAARFLPLPWDEQRAGMVVIAKGNPWQLGGPAVFHAEWWLRAHWGRAFKLASIDGHEDDPDAHGWVALRKRTVELTAPELETPEPGEPRELEALLYNLEALHAVDMLVRTHPSGASGP